MSTATIAPVNPMSAEGKDTVMSVMRRDRVNFTRLVSDPKNGNVMTRCTGCETLNEPDLDFRKLPREEALARFKTDAEKLDGILDALTPEEWTGLMVYQPFAGPVPAGFYGTFQIMDYGVHPYDIEYGLGNKLATIDEATAGLILPYSFIFWMYTVDQKVAAGVDAQYGIETDGPWGGKWRATIKDGKWSQEAEKGNFEGCDALFHFDSAADHVLTFFGRFPGGSATGDPEVIHKVRHLFFSF